MAGLEATVRNWAGGEKRPPETLPPVIPFVVYNGSSSWTALTDGDEALSRELDRMVNAGEIEAMRSLAAERWKERNRQREAQILAQGRTQGREEGLEFHRRQLGSLAARRFGADAGESLSALLADVSEPQRLAAVGDAIIDCGTGAELLAAARRIVGATD